MQSGWEFLWIDGYDQVLSAGFCFRWQALVDRCPHARVFQEPAVARAWLESKAMALGLSPRFCWGSSAAGHEVLVPFCLRPCGPRNAWQRRLTALGEPHFDYQDPAAAAQEQTTLDWDGFWESLSWELSRTGTCEHAMLLRLSPTVSPRDTRADDCGESPYIPLLAFRSLDELLQQRSASHRSNVRRRSRSLLALGELQLHACPPGDRQGAGEELERLRAAYERLWDGTPSSTLFRQPGTLLFYEKLLDYALPQGLVHFSTLRLNGRPISWHFGFLHRGVLHWYKPTYDVAFRKFSPGKVHLALLVDLGIRQGWKEIDLGCGQEQYKYDWTDAARPLAQWHWRAATWRARFGWWAGRTCTALSLRP